jgi:hypothetical protein
MKDHLKKSLALLGCIALFLGMGQSVHAFKEHNPANAPTAPVNHPPKPDGDKKERQSLELLMDAHAALEAAGVSGGEYTARTARELYFDAFRVSNFTFHFSIKEKSLFTSSPNQLDHEFTYVGIKHNTPRGNITFFWDHTCNNPSRKLPKSEKNGIHWNELGAGYETPGMAIGHRNDGITFNSGSEWLNKINWNISLSKIWMRTENEYEWMGKLIIRYDVFRHERHILYVQAGLSSLYDDRGFNRNYSVETGNRFCWRKEDCLIPFISYEKFHDWYESDRGEDFFLIGLRLEMTLGKDDRTYPDAGNGKGSWNPEIHITGGYANFIHDDRFGHRSDFSLNLDLLKWDSDKKFTMNTYAGILTLPDDLNPYLVKYEIGPSLSVQLHHYELQLFHSYACLYGVDSDSVIRDYHLSGVGLQNQESFPWHWHLKLGGYPASKNFDYWGDLAGSVRYTFIERRISPYILFSGHLLAGNDPEFGYTVEPGIKIHGKAGSFSVYYSRQEDYDIFRYGKGKYTLLGIRFEF